MFWKNKGDCFQLHWNIESRNAGYGDEECNMIFQYFLYY